MEKPKPDKNVHLLPLSTMIEVICINGEEITKTEMSFEDALKMKKEKHCIYKNYQLGVSQYLLSQKKL